MSSPYAGRPNSVTVDDGFAHGHFPGRSVPAAFARHVVSIAPGREHRYDPVDWQDAIVVVEHGAIDLDCLAGGSRRFGEGSVLFMVGLPLRALCNRGTEAATLVAVSRRR